MNNVKETAVLDKRKKEKKNRLSSSFVNINHDFNNTFNDDVVFLDLILSSELACYLHQSIGSGRRPTTIIIVRGAIARIFVISGGNIIFSGL